MGGSCLAEAQGTCLCPEKQEEEGKVLSIIDGPLLPGLISTNSRNRRDPKTVGWHHVYSIRIMHPIGKSTHRRKKCAMPDRGPPVREKLSWNLSRRRDRFPDVTHCIRQGVRFDRVGGRVVKAMPERAIP